MSSDINFQTTRDSLGLIHKKAEQNFSQFAEHPFPGNGLIIGIDKECQFLIHLYFVTTAKKMNFDTNENEADNIEFVFGKKNRHFLTSRDNRKNISSTDCWTMSMSSSFFVNHSLQSHLNESNLMKDSNCSFQNDLYNFTPNIFGISNFCQKKHTESKIGIIKKNKDGGKEVCCFNLALTAGLGNLIYSYHPDQFPGSQNCLPSFSGKPLGFPVISEGFEHLVWSMLKSDQRRLLCLKKINLQNPEVQITTIIS